MLVKDVKYKTLVATLRKNILGGKYDVDNSFPSVRAIIKRFGLSKTTVQHALDDLVHQGFIFREQGRGTFVTKMGANRQIGLIIPGLAYSEFFHPIFSELSRLCQEKEYGLLFGGGFSSETKLRENQAIALAKDLVKKSVCGVIMQPTEMSENAKAVNGQILRILEESNVPVVLLDSDIVSSPERSKYDVVGIDNDEAGRRAVRHLIGQGARRISFASWPYSCTSIADRRIGARAEAHDHRGIAFKEVFLDPSDGDAVRRHIARFRPNAIICGYDTFAAYLKVQLEKIGKCVPDDIMMVGFDDLQDARITTPPLTTSHQPCIDIARYSFSLLLERVANRTLAPRKIVLHAPLVIRASTQSGKRGGCETKQLFWKTRKQKKGEVMNIRRTVVSHLLAAGTAIVLAATPLVGQCVTIDVTKFQQRYPWNGLVDIDYTITRTDGEAALNAAKHSVRISVVNCGVAPAETNVAHVFRQGALPVSDGSHRVTWDANAEGINFNSQNVKVFAEIVHYAEKYMVIDVSGGPNTNCYPVTYMIGAPEGGFTNNTYRGDKIALRLIPPGSFVMGSPTTEPGRKGGSGSSAYDTSASEVQHPVAITKPFYIGVFEITQKQYKNVMNADPSMYKGDYRPVERVSYNTIRGTAEPNNNHKYDWPHNSDVDMQSSFMGQLRAKCKEQNLSGEWESVSGLFDLPTDAQWEYACRAGKTTPFNNGEPCANDGDLDTQLTKLGCYKSNGGSQSRHIVVGTAGDPNAWGLYDMHGNVFEWCLDWYQEDVQNIENPSFDPVGPSAGAVTGATRVPRGGACLNDARDCRSACRGTLAPTRAEYFVGFRLSRTLP